MEEVPEDNRFIVLAQILPKSNLSRIRFSIDSHQKQLGWLWKSLLAAQLLY